MTPSLTPDVVPRPEEAVENSFAYGWRFVKKPRPDGGEDSVKVPLTIEDVLHPLEGDCIPENTIQEWDRRYIHDVIEVKVEDDPAALTLADCLIDWGDEELRTHSPDISYIEGVEDPDRDFGTFFVEREGVRPRVLMEIVSPNTRNNDVVIKVDHYHKARVEIYVVIDQEKEGGPRRIYAYEWKTDGYVLIPPDSQGRVLIEPLGFLMGLRDNHVVCFDAASGEEIPDYASLDKKYAAATRALVKAEVQARDDRLARLSLEKLEKQERLARREAQDLQLKADEARLAAEQREREESQARQAAEQREREESQARQAAEQREREESKARAAAQLKAQEERNARLAAEAELLEIREKLRRLQSGFKEEKSD